MCFNKNDYMTIRGPGKGGTRLGAGWGGGVFRRRGLVNRVPALWSQGLGSYWRHLWEKVGKGGLGRGLRSFYKPHGAIRLSEVSTCIVSIK